MKILVTGGKGMLGRTLARRFADHELFVADLPEVDMLDPSALAAAFDSFRPDAVVHCAAMTRVDDCETARDLAFSLNRDGSRNVAEAAVRARARLVAISTDYVFSGDLPRDRSWREDDEPAPRTVYGASKLAGERAALAACPGAVVLRIAWLYGAGGPSFVHTMARLGAAGGAPVRVVDDQVGNPTSCDAVADAIRFILGRPEIAGVVHGTCEGVCSWYDLASEVFARLGLKRGLAPCTTAELPRPASRPANSSLEKSVLRSFGYEPRPWRDALADFITQEFRP